MTHACLEKLMRAKLSGYEEVCSLTSDHAGNVVRATIDVYSYISMGQTKFEPFVNGSTVVWKPLNPLLKGTI